MAKKKISGVVTELARRAFIAQIAMNDDELGPIAVGDRIEMNEERAAPLVDAGWLVPHKESD